MKKIALLCLVAFAHGCCCPSSSSNDIVNQLIVDEQTDPILFPLYDRPQVTSPNSDDLKKLVFNEAAGQVKTIIPLINDENTFKGKQAEYSKRFFVGMMPQGIFCRPVLVEKTGPNQYRLIGSDPVEYVKGLLTEQNYPQFCEILLEKVGAYIDTHDPYPRIKIGEGSRLQVWQHNETTFVAPEGHAGFFIPFTQIQHPDTDLNNLLFDEHNRPRAKGIKWTTIDQIDLESNWPIESDSGEAPGIMFVYKRGRPPFAEPIVVILQKRAPGFNVNIISDYAIPGIAIPMLSKVVFTDSDLATREDD